MTVTALKKNNMERKSKNGGFRLKGHTLPGINQMKTAKMADGRAKSSTFQKTDENVRKTIKPLPTVEVSGGKAGNKKKYNAAEEAIQKEVEMQLKKDITKRNLSKSDARKAIREEVIARRKKLGI